MKLSLRLARFISILGHPMLVMPLAAWLAIRSSGSGVHASLGLIAGIVLPGIVVLGYSTLQVCRGRWRHVDASGRSERQSLNQFLLVLFATSTAVAWLSLGMAPLTIALSLSAVIILFALLLASCCKLSLHVAFIVFAACIPGTLAAGLGIGVLAGAVAWSRFRLARHTTVDLLAGLLAGVAAGIVWLSS